MSFDHFCEALKQRRGKQPGTKAMIDVLMLGRRYGYAVLKEALEKALDLSCFDVEAVRLLLAAQQTEKRPCGEAIEIGALRADDRPQPTTQNYDQLLANGLANGVIQHFPKVKTLGGFAFSDAPHNSRLGNFRHLLVRYNYLLHPALFHVACLTIALRRLCNSYRSTKAKAIVRSGRVSHFGQRCDNLPVASRVHWCPSILAVPRTAIVRSSEANRLRKSSDTSR